MPSRSSRTLAVSLLSALAAAVMLLSVAEAEAGTLDGQVTDSLTGTPISGASVRVLGTNRTTQTDGEGRWSFELSPGSYQLEVEATVGGRTHRFRVVRQRVPQYKPADTRVYTTHFSRPGAEAARKRPVGFPVARIDHPSDRDRGAVDLVPPTDGSTPDRLTLPDQIPSTIRVARRENKETCAGSDIVAIEELPLEEYVQGVLVPEIGVFQHLDNVGEVYEAFARAAKSYGLYFMLVYGPDNRRQVDSPKPPHDYTWFHIDDTPCNQRYSDKRMEITNEAASRTAGEILVKKGAPQTLDKYEYAASCGQYGTRAAYDDEIIPDEPSVTSCVEDWCGHESCAGHEDHPDKPGDDRCLVRGICQWGAAEWAETGRDDSFILDHYQPKLEIRSLADDGDATVELTGYVHSNPDDVSGSGIPGASVALESGATTTTNSRGRYTFPEVALSVGTVSITAEKAGWTSATRDKRLTPGQTNWASIRLAQPGGDGELGDVADGGDARSDAESPPADRASPSPDSEGTGRPYGGVGPLFSNSRGTASRGCSSRTFGPITLPGLAVLLAFLGSTAGRRR